LVEWMLAISAGGWHAADLEGGEADGWERHDELRVCFDSDDCDPWGRDEEVARSAELCF
jgi:hypothetical protein